MVKKMNKKEDLVGKVFGRWTVIKSVDEKHGHNSDYWTCKCTCGKTSNITRYDLTNGHSKSCGCYSAYLLGNRKRKHGARNTRLYSIWLSIRNRCNRVRNDNYKWYGARGIQVCDTWNKDFIAFREWALANGYNDNLTIDRINSNMGYYPENCRWSDMTTQNNNRRDNVLIKIGDEVDTLSNWAKHSGIPYGCLYRRKALGWSEDELLLPKGEKR